MISKVLFSVDGFLSVSPLLSPVATNLRLAVVGNELQFFLESHSLAASFCSATSGTVEHFPKAIRHMPALVLSGRKLEFLAELGSDS